MLRYALAYAAEGLPVFPCAANGEAAKSPLVRGGFKSATTDEKQIKTWWAEFPNAAIGMPTGKPTGLLVLDADGEEGKQSLERLRKVGPIPKTIAHHTPSGGFHLFFAFDERIRSSVNSLERFSKIDVRSEGGYVILPPSEIGGKLYRCATPMNLLKHAREVPELPEWLAEMLQSKSPKKAPEIGDNIEQGERNSKLWQLGQMMRWQAGATREEIESALFAFNKTRCKPPLPAEEVRRIVTSLVTHTWIGERPEFLEPENKDTPSTRFPVVRISDMRNRPPRPMLIENLIGVGDRVMFYGEPKAGKSFVVLDMAITCAMGATWANQFKPVRPLRVVYATAEGIAGLHQRVESALEGLTSYRYVDEDLIEENLLFVERLPMLFQPRSHLNAAQFAKDLEPYKPDIVILDTLAKAAIGANENDARDMGIALAQLDIVSRHLNTATVLVHHSNKGGTDRGSTAIAADLDLQLCVEITPGGSRTIRPARTRWFEPFEPLVFNLVQEGDSARVAWLAGEAADRIRQASGDAQYNERKPITLGELCKIAAQIENVVALNWTVYEIFSIAGRSPEQRQRIRWLLYEYSASEPREGVAFIRRLKYPEEEYDNKRNPYLFSLTPWGRSMIN